MCRHHGLDPKVEARYRKEGARVILDCGAKMGLRYETCATGVVYFHRFYLFHSFREFNRYTTAACCLFLAGKVEETPKKCKDIIRVVRSMLTDQQFASFGEDPREEVMTMERILLQTIRFDLQVEHPYKYLLKYAKFLKGDKEKIEQMVQMAWTFINDSLCTRLCLQWEPDVMAVALMYLGSRLKTFEVTDWHGKTPTSKGKWWNNLVEDITFELLEDICHQVLDLYSSPSTQTMHDDSPPPPPPPRQPPTLPHPHNAHNAHNAHNKRSRSNTPSDANDVQRDRDRAAGAPPSKLSRHEQERSKSPSPTPNKDKNAGSRHPTPHGPGTPVKSRSSSNQVSPQVPPNHATGGPQPNATGPPYPRQDGVQYNPYLSAGMYQASFMSGEGAQNIQNLMSGGSSSNNDPPPPSSGVQYSQHTPPPGRPYNQHNYPQQPPYPNYQQPPPPTPGSYQGPPPPGTPQPPYPPNYQQPPPQQPPPGTPQPPYNQYQYTNYNTPGAGKPAPNYPPPPPQPGYQGQPPPPPVQNSQSNPAPSPYPQQYTPNPRFSQPPPPAGAPPPGGQYSYSNPAYPQPPYQGAPPNQSYSARGPPPPNQGGHPQGPPPPGGLPTVRITGRR